MKKKRLRRLLPVWQKRLRLQDWDIALTFHPQLEMGGKAATVEWKCAKRSAWIKMLLPGSWAHARSPEFDTTQEVSLVHELLHLKYAGWDETETNSLAETLLEQGVHDISRALVAA